MLELPLLKIERIEKETVELKELLKISETKKDQKDLEEKVKEAAISCPVEAMIIEE